MTKDYLTNRKRINAIIIVYIVILGLVLTYWRQSNLKAELENLNTEFAGTVVHIQYDPKQNPSIKIGDSSYYIGAGYDTDHQIEVGDSVIKKRGSIVYTLIKLKSGEIVEFKK